MSLYEDTLSFGAERDRLAEAVDDLQGRLAKADVGDEAADYSLNELNQQGRGVHWCIEEYGPDAEVTVAALSAGEFARVEDRVHDAGPGVHRNVFAAAGLVDAPWLPERDGETDGEWLDTKVAAVADLPVGVVKWLYATVDERTTVGEGNWRRSSDAP